VIIRLSGEVVKRKKKLSRLILYAIALLLPTLAILGFFEGGRQVMALAEDPAWIAQLAQERRERIAGGEPCRAPPARR
jgi:hypothetical protein